MSGRPDAYRSRCWKSIRALISPTSTSNCIAAGQGGGLGDVFMADGDRSTLDEPRSGSSG